MTPVVLASASPRRRELLGLIGIPHEVRPAHIDETVRAGEAARPHAERLAREKARAVGDADASAIVIAADTIVVVDDVIVGKPVSGDDAARMLRLLSGREHIVLTAVAVARKGVVESGVEEVRVTFRPIGDDEIRRYIATGEPMDKAGAYGIQGYGATIVQRIDGDYFAVMGLALGLLVQLLGRLGVRYEFGPLDAAPR